MPEARKSIQSLPEYRSPIIGRTHLNLDLNENTGGCSPRVLSKLRSLTAVDVACYPQRETGEALVAGFMKLDPQEILLTNGIDEGLQLLFATYLDGESELLIVDPTFSMYSLYGRATGRLVHAVPYETAFEFPTAPLLQAVNSHTRLIVIANPNNPTGTIASQDDLRRIVSSAPHAGVVIDEAYFEFHGQSMLPQLNEFPNLFITRTFSKAYGLAGLRLGLVAGSASEVSLLRRLTSPFNINSVALFCLHEALQDHEFVHNYVEQIEEGREQIYQLCRELGLTYWPSEANFVLVKIGADSEEFVASMRNRGIALSDRAMDRGCHGCVRVTVGTREEMPLLLKAFRESLPRS
jgi:histidinol-phosphate aminotransferase